MIQGTTKAPSEFEQKPKDPANLEDRRRTDPRRAIIRRSETDFRSSHFAFAPSRVSQNKSSRFVIPEGERPSMVASSIGASKAGCA